MITQSDRDVPIIAHVTAVTKERMRAEAARRKISVSLLVSEFLEAGLERAEEEELAFKRSNKRSLTLINKDMTQTEIKDISDRLAAGETIEILPAIPGHSHSYDGKRFTCGCQINVPLPMEKE